MTSTDRVRAMTVAELIAELANLDPDLPVLEAPRVAVCHGSDKSAVWTFPLVGYSAPRTRAEETSQ